MGIPSSQTAAAWIKSAAISVDWQDLPTVCFQAVRQMWTGRSEEEIYDYVEEHLFHIAEHLRDEVSFCAMDGTLPKYELDDEQPPFIRAIGSQSFKLLDALRLIDPFKVEEICADVLKKLGANSYATQKTYDGGIDFIGTEINIVPGSLTVPSACKATIIGQTKRYKEGNIVSEKQLREFVGSALLRRHNMRSDGRIAALGPVILAFWTTSNFEPNAKIYARALGIWFMDGHTFCHYISSLNMEETVLELAALQQSK